ncbi:MAG TPA: SUMF1/EgtB/PvdO family nonheme iron enzyme, partial [Blastocatellia bacterium]|nr:SUMF1/EgtB/PvdO family nonheme iron enzyme [Blastocatellia bacterium]
SVYTIFFRNPKPGPTVRIVDPVPAPTAEPVSEKAVPAPPPGMVFIPGGTFTMGYGEAAPDNPSGPEHEVTVNPYFIDKFEVTRAAYSPRRNLSGDAGQLPATNLTWREARDYCQKIGKRLPTEEEWEFAARGGDRRIYPWGNRFEPNRANVGSPRLAPVGSFPAGDSPFGLSDMSGNALEWTDSYFTNYSGSLYQRRQCKEPCRVIRGGAYFDDPKDATVVFRREYEPTTLNRVKNAYAVLGFRCAQDATPR